MTAPPEEKGYIALVNPPAQTNAGVETVLSFAQEVLYVYIQNNTTQNLNVAIDATATAGSLVLAPSALMVLEKEATQTVHLYTATAQNINGATSGNIVVLGAV